MDIVIITRIIISKILKKTKESAISLDECFDMAIKNRDLAIADKRFVYNVIPRNKKFMKFLQKNGYMISQQTVVKYFE